MKPDYTDVSNPNMGKPYCAEIFKTISPNSYDQCEKFCTRTAGHKGNHACSIPDANAPDYDDSPAGLFTNERFIVTEI